MVDLIEYPTNRVGADAYPRPGDRYEAYGLAAKREPVTLVLVRRDWSWCALAYGRMGVLRLKPLDDRENGEARLSVFFETTAGDGILAEIVGSGLGHCSSALANRQLRWVWQMPEDREAVAEGSPWIRLITFRRASNRELFDLMFDD